jgi:hypothetical protein
LHYGEASRMTVVERERAGRREGKIIPKFKLFQINSK